MIEAMQFGNDYG